MALPLRLWLVICSANLVHSSKDFLETTLEKIQKERLDSSVYQNQTDNSPQFSGEIIFEAEDNNENSIPEENYEFSFSNAIEDEKHQPESGDNVQLPYLQNIHHDGSQGVKEGQIQGYYYYFYPLNHYIQNLQQHQPNEPIKDSMRDDMMNMMMDSMMKTTMNNTTDTNVAPLFKAMTWFIGTAMIFVISILLMPKFRVKKGKDVFEGRHFSMFPLNSSSSLHLFSKDLSPARFEFF